MKTYTYRYISNDVGEDFQIKAPSINEAKNKLKDHENLDLFFWSANAQRYFCEACLRDGVWSSGYGYGETA